LWARAWRAIGHARLRTVWWKAHLSLRNQRPIEPLLHGGLRYLAQGRLGLVYEASREKMILHRIAPHLAEPLPFLFPTYRGTPCPAGNWRSA